MWPLKQDQDQGKACSIHHMVVTTAREHIRARYARKSLIPHGLKLTISKHNGDDPCEHKRLRSSQLRKIREKTAFDYKRFVKGWKSPKHVAYCKENGFTIPSIPELELGSSESQQSKAAIPKAKAVSRKSKPVVPSGSNNRQSDLSSNSGFDSDGSEDSSLHGLQMLLGPKRSRPKEVCIVCAELFFRIVVFPNQLSLPSAC